MPTRRENLINNEIYHVVTRGIEGKDIFRDTGDYCRVIDNLFEFNNSKPTQWHYRQLYRQHHYEDGNRSSLVKQERDLIVEILAFCLMPNHIHLLLRQIKEGGITKFMRKLGSGYANYFNKKYERQGYLFQGRFRSVHVKNNNQLKSVFVYIHTNPAILIDSNWKEGGIKKSKDIVSFIEDYKWSSYMDYLGRNNFPLITQRNFFYQIMTQRDWQKFVNEWVEHKKEKGHDEAIELE